MNLVVINALYVVIIWQSVFFGIILTTSKYHKKISNIFLSLNLLSIGIQFVINFLMINGYLNEHPLHICSYGFLYGPLLYFFIKFSLLGGVKFRSLYLLHFLPFALIVAASILGYNSCDTLKDWLLPSMLVYFSLAFRKIIIYRKTIPQISANIKKTETNWLLVLIAISIINGVLSILSNSLVSFNLNGFELRIGFFVLFGVFIFVNWIIYHGIINPGFFIQITDTDVKIASLSRTNNKNVASGENLELLTTISYDLSNHMKRHKPFLDAHISLGSLAKSLKVHPKVLSQVINRIEKKNFSDYINSLRIIEVKKILKKEREKNVSIKEIMYATGFTSRSVFNTIFKKKTGLTPSEYRDKLL